MLRGSGHIPAPELELIGPVLLLLAVLILLRTRLSPVLVFLAAGMAAGPSGFGVIAHPDTAEVFLYVGLLFVLFGIGTQLRIDTIPQTLSDLETTFANALLVALPVGSAALLLGVGPADAVFTAFLATVGSVAYLSPKLHSSDAAAARRSQGLFVVLLLLALPVLGASGDSASHLLKTVAVLTGFAATLLLLMSKNSGTRRSKLIGARASSGWGTTVGALSLGIMVVSYAAGPGLAVGALLAGILVGVVRVPSPALFRRSNARSFVAGLCFVPLGMMVDLRVLAEHAGIVIMILLAVMSLRTAIALVRPRFKPRIGLRNAPLLISIGELTVLLLLSGREYGLTPGGLGHTGEQIFLIIAVLSLAAAFALAHARSSSSTAAVPVPTHRVSAPADPSRLQQMIGPDDDSRGSDDRSGLHLVTVEPGASASLQTLSELGLWSSYQIYVAAVWRGDAYFANPDSRFRLSPSDRVLLAGRRTQVAESLYLFRGSFPEIA